jgi:hypothetical protein
VKEQALPLWAKDTPADHSGVYGRAWKVDLATYRHKRVESQATLACWILNCPGAHLLWSWWLLSVIHLRNIEGAKPANVRLPGATHEVIVASLNPDYPPPNPKAFGDEDIRILIPIDVTEQFTVGSDVEANEVCDLAAFACCAGTLSPDQDFRAAWSRHLQATAEHYRSGVHRADS